MEQYVIFYKDESWVSRHNLQLVEGGQYLVEDEDSVSQLLFGKMKTSLSNLSVKRPTLRN